MESLGRQFALGFTLRKYVLLFGAYAPKSKCLGGWHQRGRPLRGVEELRVQERVVDDAERQQLGQRGGGQKVQVRELLVRIVRPLRRSKKKSQAVSLENGLAIWRTKVEENEFYSGLFKNGFLCK